MPLAGRPVLAPPECVSQNRPMNDKFPRKLLAILYAEGARVCVSETVKTTMGNRLEIGCEALGEQHGKNIAELVKAYGGIMSSASVSVDGPLAGVALELPHRPSIVTLPFANMCCSNAR